MSDPEPRPDDEAEVPLDPAAERLRRRLMRLMFVSIGIMLIGVFAVFAAVVLRQPTSTGEPTDGTLRAIDLPGGARVVETAIDPDSILLRVATETGERLLVVSRASGEITARYALGSDDERAWSD